ncbi:hypothetical protein MBLNU13_g00545t2 [Cladosporium sp. NU13]
MSASLISDLPSTVSAVLDQLDEIETSPHYSGQHSFHDRYVGPFGVFESRVPLLNDENASIVDTSPQVSPSAIAGIVHGPRPPVPTTSSPCPRSSDRSFGTLGGAFEFHESLDDFLTSSLDTMQWGDLFQWDLDYPFFAEADVRSVELNIGRTATLKLTDSETAIAIDTSRHECSWPEIDLSNDAPLLLKHFNEAVITQMGSLPINEKSAWRTLNFPSAVFTLSQLTILGFERNTIKCANLANFFALIAVSALHLSLSPRVRTDPNVNHNSYHWKTLSERTYEAAKNFLKSSLSTECTLQSKAKYKDLLMAVGAILATALVSGNDKDARRYLVEMERLIRNRGLTKRVISRRARLLHNVYAWMRIVSESTYVSHDDPQLSELVGVTTAENCFTEPSADGLPLHSLQEASTKGLDSFLYLVEYKTQPLHGTDTDPKSAEGQLDLHLTSPLVDRDGMCMQIYGVPETWLRLVSQITRLANLLDKISPGAPGADFEVFTRLQATSATLESAVCAFQERFQVPVQGASPHEYMVRALSAALVIFFYRRIKRIRPLMLQESVTQVITSLLDFDTALQQYNMPGPGTAWPAFMAGAEAMHQPQRQAISAWLNKANLRSGWKGYTTSQRILDELWGRRGTLVGSHELPTWVEVCRDLRCWPLLC